MKSKRHRTEERDILNDLPDFVLLHIMKFMNAKQAVQTCVLSTRWKDLWRQLTNLALDFSDISYEFNFIEFLSKVLSLRDHSIPLHDIDLRWKGCIDRKLLDWLSTYAVSHNVQRFSVELIHTCCDTLHRCIASGGYTLHACIFSCQSVKHLKHNVIFSHPWMTIFTGSLQLPSLTSLHLCNALFAANNNGVVDPFSNCHMLRTLVLDGCQPRHNAKPICISNSKLSSLTIGSTTLREAVSYKVVLSTPNLTSITLISRDLIHLVIESDLCFLEQVNIDIDPDFRFEPTYLSQELVNVESCLISWLQMLANYVKILTLSSSTLMVLLHPTSSSIRSKIPCFFRLMSLKLRSLEPSNINISTDPEKVRRLVNWFRKRSPQVTVYID